ncbi:MAG: FtsW/RodA/SpoVE family cell cycle protein [Tannerellaceae bacterium]|nr:FtsW/RodA/SpoVE family cell cycle protein [Tannerellaceae bacterium]MCD8265308.1 FtsW/RodA/SpoVE family cell cycle protein [Tannerellaceae bacterium]
MDFTNKLFKGDRVIWLIFMFLCVISVVEVFSATSTLAYKNANHWGPIARHASMLSGGFVMALILSHIPSKYFRGLVVLLPVSIFMLAITPFFGVKTNDASRWLQFFGIQFQPSELAKLSLVIFIAFVLSKRSKFTENQMFNYISAGALLTCLLIFPQNFSTAFMLFGVSFLMMFIGQLPMLKLGKLAGVLLLCMALLGTLLVVTPAGVLKSIPRAATWKERINEFTHKEKHTDGDYVITDDNYQVAHAKIAIARGGIFGQLPGHGQQRDFLPQAYSDFIYAIIFEELGFVGAMFILALYLMLLVRVGMIARKCGDKLFPKFLVLGCGLLIVIQAMFNMAVAVGLFPVTGQPLPLVSRGGTSTVITCLYFGIILSVSRFGAGMGDEKDELPEEEMALQPVSEGNDTMEEIATI